MAPPPKAELDLSVDLSTQVGKAPHCWYLNSGVAADSTENTITSLWKSSMSCRNTEGFPLPHPMLRHGSSWLVPVSHR